VKRYRLTGMLDARGIEPDPEGFLVRYVDVASLLSDQVQVALLDYAEKLDAWDASTHEGVHSFESAGLDDGLRAALRAERDRRAKGGHPCLA
jgi:hypothetical protein